jgi:hypothetical protein
VTHLIPEEEIIWHPGSFGDAGGRLFRWNGRLLRGLTGDAADLLRTMATDGSLAELVAQGVVVETTATELSTSRFALVVEHVELRPVTYANEWPAEMLRSAAELVLRLQTQLRRRGLTLHDAHPWNVVFDGTHPVWVDITSIERATSRGWPAAEEFRRFFLNPMRLFDAGQHRVARQLLRDFHTGVDDREA